MSRARFRSQDYFIAAGNPDDSGSVRHTGRSAALGLMYKHSEVVHYYVNAGRGFETPTLAELSYRAGGASGLNFALKPSRSEQIEAGVKVNTKSGQRIRLAVFDITTRDEIVVNASGGGRTDFKNAGRTSRQGLEASWEADFGSGVEAYVAWTVLDATYRDAFTSGTPPVTIAAGRRLPGVASNTLYGELLWRHRSSGLHAAAEIRRVGSVPVDDQNSESANAYTVASARIGFEQRARSWRVSEFLRVDNLGDRKYAGSVIVAEGNRRFYEPAPGRNYLLGIEASISF
jgi:iron complex outermembrane receptor protein